MTPNDTGKAYDSITHLWQSEKFDRHNGIDAHKRALSFVENSGNALDIGCGCTGRILDLLLERGLSPEGIDVSQRMIELAQQRHPQIPFHHHDICTWSFNKGYDFISAWDSIWHLPLEQQEPVLTKIVKALNPDGVFIFSFGGTDEKGEHRDNFMGPEVSYSTLGTNGFLSFLRKLGCVCKHLEFDQHPSSHAYIIVQKPS